jgi:hypothetical protein
MKKTKAKKRDVLADRTAAIRTRLVDLATGAGIDTGYVGGEDGGDLVSSAGSQALYRFCWAIRATFPFTDRDGGRAQDVLAYWNFDEFEDFDRLAAFLVKFVAEPVGMAKDNEPAS